jgi:transposase-like protein
MRWRLVKTSGRSIAEVARSLDIAQGTLWNWVRKSRDADARAEDPDGLSESERDELRRLRTRNMTRSWKLVNPRRIRVGTPHRVRRTLPEKPSSLLTSPPAKAFRQRPCAEHYSTASTPS